VSLVLPFVLALATAAGEIRGSDADAPKPAGASSQAAGGDAGLHELKLARVHEILELASIGKVEIEVLRASMDDIARHQKSQPGFDQAMWDHRVAIMLADVPARLDDLAAAFDKYLSDAEVGDLDDFYRSDIGKRVLVVKLRTALEGARLTQDWSTAERAKLLAEIEDGAITPQPAPGASASAAAVAAPAAQRADAEHQAKLADIAEVRRLANNTFSGLQAVSELMETLKQQEQSRAVSDELWKSLEQQALSDSADLDARFIRMYDEGLSRDELRKAIAFYSTPEALHMRQVIPRMVGEANQKSADRYQRLVAEDQAQTKTKKGASAQAADAPLEPPAHVAPTSSGTD
jgi:hypothetical protein